MKSLLATAVGTELMLIAGVSYAANGHMMDGGAGGGGWMGGYSGMGGHGGVWVPTLLVIVVVAVVAWVLSQKRK